MHGLEHQATPTNDILALAGFHLGGTFAPLCQSLAPPWKSLVAIFFQRVIGCNGYRTETQHKEYTA